MADDEIEWGPPAAPDDVQWSGSGGRDRQRAYRESIRQGDPTQPAQMTPAPGPDLSGERLSGPEFRKQWQDVGVGAVKGVPATLAGGMLGDVEEMGRLLGKEFGVAPHTYIPTTVEGGYLGPRGLGLMDKAQSPQEAGGMTLASIFGPAGALKALRRAPVVPEVPKKAGELIPFEMHPEASVASPRPSGARLLGSDAPHTIPAEAETIVPRGMGPARAGAGAEAATPVANVSEKAVERARALMNEQGLTPETLDQRLSEMSSHQFLGELTPGLVDDTYALYSHPGASKREVLNAFRDRRAELPERFQNLLNRAMGEPINVPQERQILSFEQKQAADPLYQQFKSLRIPPTDEIRSIMDRLRAAGAFGEAKKFAAVKGKPFDITHFTTGEQKIWPTAESWDLVKQSLDAKIEKSFNSRGEPTKWTAAYTELKHELINAIDNHPNPEVAGAWKAARDAFAGPAQIKSAHRMGERILTEGIKVDELPFLTAGYSEKQMEALLAGVRANIQNKLGRKLDADPRVIAELLSENNQAKIRWVAGDARADELFKGIAYERQMLKNADRVLSGSDTGWRTVASKRWDVPEVAPGMTPMEMVGAGVGALRHPVRTAASTAVDLGTRVLNKRTEAATKARVEEMAKLREELSTIMTLQGPERDAFARWLLGSAPTARAAGGRVPFAEGGDVEWEDLPRSEEGRPQITVTPDVVAAQEARDAAAARLRAQGSPNQAFRARANPQTVIRAGEMLGEGLYETGRKIVHDLPKRMIEESQMAAGDVVPTEISDADPTPGEAAGDWTKEMVAATFGPKKLFNMTPLEQLAKSVPGQPTRTASFYANPKTVQPPFYSALQRAIENAKIETATPDQWLGYLRNQPGVKAEEIEWTLRQLPEGQIKRDELAGIQKANQIELKEINRGGLDEAAKQDWIETRMMEIQDDLAGQHGRNPEDFYQTSLRQAQREFDAYNMSDLQTHKNAPRFSEYQLPGATNYREVQLVLPQEMKPTGRFVVTDGEGGSFNMAANTRTEAEQIQREVQRASNREITIIDEMKPEPGYVSSHWPDDPNTFAHVRMNDREIPGVGKSLHLEEVQSDWHQAGRKRGYGIKTVERPGALPGDIPHVSTTGVPDAPFKSTWADLSLKRMIREAAEKGYDSLSWTAGEAQAARYDLSRQVSSINVEPDGTKAGARSVAVNLIGDRVPGYVEVGVDKDGVIFDSTQAAYRGKPLSDLVGKDLADKIMAKEQQTLEGLDLKVGGEGMKGFYDKMLVDKANAIAKKYGAKVKTVETYVPAMEGKEHAMWGAFDGNDIVESFPTRAQAEAYVRQHGRGDPEWSVLGHPDSIAPTSEGTSKVHVLPMTPELREAALQGFALFANKADPKTAARNEALQSGNPGVHKGKPFWSGAFDPLDGHIIETHPFQKAEKADFHHSMYFSDRAQEAMKDGRAQFFWLDKDGNIQTQWREAGAKPEIVQAIKDQLFANKVDPKTAARNEAALGIVRGQPVPASRPPPTAAELATARADTRSSGDIVSDRINIIVPEQERVVGGVYTPGAPGGGRWADLPEETLSKPGVGFHVTDNELQDLWNKSVAESSQAAKNSVAETGATPTFKATDWDAAMKLPLRDVLWYELSGEKLAENLPGLARPLFMKLMDLIGATSARAKPGENLERSLAVLSQQMRGVPVDVDLTQPAAVREALSRQVGQSSALPGNKTGYFSDTLALTGGIPTRYPISVNDVWVGKMFGIADDVMTANQSLHEPMAKYFNKIRDLYNQRHGASAAPEAQAPFTLQSWNFQAPAWVHLRAEETGDAYHQVWGNIVNKLKNAGVPGIEGDQITKEALMDPKFADALRRTVGPYRESPKATYEFNTTQTNVGRAAHDYYRQAVEQGDVRTQKEYTDAMVGAMYHSARGNDHAWDQLIRAISGESRNITRIMHPTKDAQFDVAGTFEGALSPNIRIPVAGLSDDQQAFFNAIAGKHLKQDGMPISQVLVADEATAPRPGFTRGYSLFVPTADQIVPTDIIKFTKELNKAGHEISLQRFPNGYQFDVVPKFTDAGPVGAAREVVENAYGTALEATYGVPKVFAHDFKSVYNTANEYGPSRVKLLKGFKDDFIREATKSGKFSASDARKALSTGALPDSIPAGVKGPWSTYRWRLDNLSGAERGLQDAAKRVNDAHATFIERVESKNAKAAAKAAKEAEKAAKKAAVPEKWRGGSITSKPHDWYSSVMRRTYAH